jgi:lipoprotein-anchoring transpeptidase ErfK/SrfK
MRLSSGIALLAGLAPLAACNSQTAQTPPPPTQLAALPAAAGATPAIPAIPPGPERDAAWMKLAPQAKIDPALARTTVDFATKEPVGTVIVDASERRLYLVQPGGKALRYPVSVGKAGMSWTGRAEVDRKLEWPDWNPPPEMIGRRPDLPPRLEGGPLSPIGARALYLAQGKKDTLFRIHGTNEPELIGQAVSSGCIRMLNADVMDLYERVPVGTTVVVR